VLEARQDALLFAHAPQRARVEGAVHDLERHLAREFGVLLVGEIDRRAATAADTAMDAKAGDSRQRRLALLLEANRGAVERAVAPRRVFEQRAQIPRQFGRVRGEARDLGIALAGRQIDDAIEELVQAPQVRGQPRRVWHCWFDHGPGSIMVSARSWVRRSNG
jgi:hypothetical protein